MQNNFYAHNIKSKSCPKDKTFHSKDNFLILTVCGYCGHPVRSGRVALRVRGAADLWTV